MQHPATHYRPAAHYSNSMVYTDVRPYHYSCVTIATERIYIRPSHQGGFSPDEQVRRVSCGALSVRSGVPVFGGRRCPVLYCDLLFDYLQ